jgi:phosphatidylserine/phosphatidylglycerophosphate/cardiolipin synthase-like enzyme
MHHKFVVIDFGKPSARVYFGSYNFSVPADTKNGENLLLVRDQRVAVSYTIEALRIFDHYHFRIAQQEAKKAKKKLQLAKPPREAGVGRGLQERAQDPRPRAVLLSSRRARKEGQRLRPSPSGV